MNNSNNTIAKNTIIYALGDIIPKALNLVTFPILTSYLSTGDYGIVNYVQSIILFLTIVTFLCLKTFYLVYYFKVGDEIAQKKLLGNLTIIVTVLNVVATILFLLVGQVFFKFIGSGVDFYPYILYGVLINFFGIFSQLPSALYRVRENPMPLTILNVLRGLLIMVCTICFVTVYPSVKTVLIIQLLITFLFSIFFIWITCKNAIFEFNWKQTKQALAFSLPLVPGDVAYYFSTMSDRILIEKYLAVSDLGLYSTASTIAGLLNIISYGAYRAIEPYFFKQYGKSGFKHEFERIRDILLMCIMGCGIGLCLFSKEFLCFFSSEGYHSAYIYVSPLVLVVVMNSLGYLYGTIMTAQSKTKRNGMISVTCASVSVSFNILLLPIIGVWSAVLASICVSFIGYSLLKWQSRYYVGFYRPLFALIIAVLFCYFLVYQLNIESISVSICIKVILYVIVVVVLMSIYKVKFSDIKKML